MYQQMPAFQGGYLVKNADFLPKVDVAETREEIIYILEIPGVEQKTVNVEISNGTLTVDGQVEMGLETSALNFLYQERPAHARFSRVLFVPPQVDSGKAEANIKNGLLMIRFPKKETGRRLPVHPLGSEPLQSQDPPSTQFSPQQQNPLYPPSSL